MKNIKTRIAAAACAAITAFCGAQAMSASAFNYSHPYSGNDQEYCERYSMGRNLRMWQTYGGDGTGNWAEGRSWSGSVKAGELLGKGYKKAHISSYNPSYWSNPNLQKNQRPESTLYNAAAWARTLANSHFGFIAQQAVWLELPKSDFNYWSSFRPGDQIILSSSHAVFVTNVNDNGTLTCAELRSGKIRWGVNYQLLNNAQTLKRTSTNTSYTLQYVVRPVKEGDANGDGWVDRNDVFWCDSHLNNANVWSQYEDYDVRMAAADVSGNWNIDSADSTEIYSYMNEREGLMVLDHRYVLAYWS